MRTESTYNGWTNYPTWRINLELWDNYEIDEFKGLDKYLLSEALKERTEMYILESTIEGIGRDYAMAFIHQVNFYEIAEMLFERNEIETETI